MSKPISYFETKKNKKLIDLFKELNEEEEENDEDKIQYPKEDNG